MPRLPTGTETTSLVQRRTKTNANLSVTFSLEVLRMVAHINLIVILLIANVITKYWVDPRVPPDTTTVYKIFGFNHACNALDYNPAKQFAALTIIFFSGPMVMFIFLSHLRTRTMYQHNEIPKWQLTFSRIVTPLNLYANGVLYMWFVNSPDQAPPQGYGFIAHYIPYMAFQISIAITAFQQANYLIARNSHPFGVSASVAKMYIRYLVIITLTCQTLTISILMSRPILDSKNNIVHQAIFRAIADLYSTTILVLPPLFSFLQIKNGETSKITFE